VRRRTQPSPARPSRARPRRQRLGQHFLSDPRILGRIADALLLSGHETVLEIGPGRGALTEALSRRARRVIAIEVDRRLAAALRETFADRPDVSIVEGDVRSVSFGELAGGPYLLAGNVPYYITTPIVFQALRRPRPDRAVFLVQREVAERMAAAAGDPAYGALSANIQAFARVELLFAVSAGAFQPPPKVESAVVRLTPLAHPAVAESDEEDYRRLVQDTFALRRKQMRRALRTITGRSPDEVDSILERAGIAPAARPETIAPDRFAKLLAAMKGEARR